MQGMSYSMCSVRRPMMKTASQPVSSGLTAGVTFTPHSRLTASLPSTITYFGLMATSFSGALTLPKPPHLGQAASPMRPLPPQAPHT